MNTILSGALASEQLLFPNVVDLPKKRKPPTRGASAQAPKPQMPDNIFLTLLPEGDAGERIDQFAQRSRAAHGLWGTPLGINRYHVSLLSLGGYFQLPPQLVTKANTVFAPIAAVTPRFEVSFDRALTFKTRQRNQPFVLCGDGENDALMNFQRRLCIASGSASDSFNPHVTLLYDSKPIDEHPIEPVSWTVSELVLVRSFYGQSRHEHLARWPLHP